MKNTEVLFIAETDADGVIAWVWQADHAKGRARAIRDPNRAVGDLVKA